MSRASAARARGRLERLLLAEGLAVAGVDEVGRGCIAGPVYAACAALDFVRLKRLRSPVRALLRDSKQLSGAQRARMVPVIQELCRDWQVASAGVEEIATAGIVGATFAAMRRALALCGAPFDVLLVDGKLPIKGYAARQETVVKGDDLCYSIAAASILAKESRDAFMREQAMVFPEYGFEAHVGYGTKQHLAMIKRHGICRLHRRTFEPIRPYVTVMDETLGDERL
jgi:ribonuclease HII